MTREASQRADTAARHAAVTCFDAPLALEAGAGTGKTSVLVERVVWWCLSLGWATVQARMDHEGGHGRTDDDVARAVAGEVVAITFTEKAAGELSHRVGQTLRAVAMGAGRGGEGLYHLPPEGHGFPAGVLQQRAAALLGAVDHMTLCTIHAFCQRLLTRHALAAGLHPAFTVDADGLAVQTVVEEVLGEALRGTMGEDRQQDLLALTAQGVTLQDAAELLSWWTAAWVDPAALERDFTGAKRLDDLREALLAPVRELAALLEPLKDNGRAKAAGAALEALWQLHRDLQRAVDPVELTAVAQRIDPVLHGRLDNYQRGDFSRTEEGALDVDAVAEAAGRCRLVVHHLEAFDAQGFELLQRALLPWVVAVRQRLNRRGIISYQGLLVEAGNLLAHHPDVAAAQRRETGLLLVDEFQDTDAVQCAMLTALVLDGPPQERPAFFVVGDPKQSIYAWRQADLRAYQRFLKELEHQGGRVAVLTVNFRSVPGVLDEVDRLMEANMAYEEGLQPAFQPLVAHRRDEDGGPAVEYWVTWLREEEQVSPRKNPSAGDLAVAEARAVARDLLRLRQSGELTSWCGAALLFRAKTAQEPYLAALRDAGIPYDVAEEADWYLRRVVLDAAALLRCVMDQSDQMALVTWLRSPAVGVPDAALLPLWQADFPDALAGLWGPDGPAAQRVQALMAAVAENVSAHAPGVDRVPSWPVALAAGVRGLAQLRQSFRSDPVDVFFRKWHALFHPCVTEAARHVGHHRLHHLEWFLARAQRLLTDPDGGPHALLRELREGTGKLARLDAASPPPQAPEGVQVMSIHRAKGLEFDHVYVPSLHRRSGVGGGGPDNQLEWLDGEPSLQLLGRPVLGFFRAQHWRQRTTGAEAVRLLYVAVTRAKRRLVLLGDWPAEPAPRPAHRATSLLDLAQNRPDVPPLTEAFAHMAQAGEPAPVTDAYGVWWLFPSLDETAPPPPVREKTAFPFTPDTVATMDATLQRHRRDAAARQVRPWLAPASAQAHEALEEALLAGREEPGVDSGPPAGAAAVGTAVHLALEVLPLEQDRETALARAKGVLDEALTEALEEGDVQGAKDRAEAVWAAFTGSPLCERLFALAPHLLGREVPLVMTGDGHQAPVGAVTGAIDLLYRDPDTGEVVVADFKTDRIEDEKVLARRREAYALQGQVYVQGVQRALGLASAPRFELWWLWLGKAEVVATSPLPAGEG